MSDLAVLPQGDIQDPPVVLPVQLELLNNNVAEINRQVQRMYVEHARLARENRRLQGELARDQRRHEQLLVFRNRLVALVRPLVDLAPVDPAPVDPAPVDPAPVDPAPVDPAPVDPAPVDPAPVDLAPVDLAPVDPAPVDPAPVDPAPVDPAPVDPAPVDPAPVDLAPRFRELHPDEHRQTVKIIRLNPRFDLTDPAHHQCAWDYVIDSVRRDMRTGEYIRDVVDGLPEVQFRPVHNLFAESYNAGHRVHFQTEVRGVTDENRRSKPTGMFNLPLEWYTVKVYEDTDGVFVDYDNPVRRMTVHFTNPTVGSKDLTSTWGGKIPNRAPYPLLAYVTGTDDREELCVVLLMKQKWEKIRD